MSAGDGIDNGETKPLSAGVADSLVARLLEQLQKRSTSSGRITAPVLLTQMLARPAVVVVETPTRPPSRWCRMALSTRLATRLSAGLGSPVTGAAVRVASTRMRSLPISPGSGLGVLAAWAAAALLAGGLLLRLRDA